MNEELRILFESEEKWSRLARWAQARNQHQLSRAWARKDDFGTWSFRFRYGDDETLEDQSSDKSFAMRSF